MLIPVRNVMHTIDTMANYCASTREERFNEYLIDFLSNFLQWLDAMAKTKPKYYNIVMLENLRFIVARLNRQSYWDEWRHKKGELEDQYKENADKYIQYIFEYQFKKYTAYTKKIRLAIKGNDFDSLKEQSDYTFKSLDKMAKGTFGALHKACKSMHDRMKKHLKSDEKVRKEMWELLLVYVEKEYDELAGIVESCYSGSALSTKREEIEKAFNSIK